MSLELTHNLPKSADVVVIGGGVLGAATAFFARRAGLHPLIIEKRAHLCTLTTPAASGAFRAQFDNPEEIALTRESIAAFENFAAFIGDSDADIELAQRGYLWLTTTDEGAARHRELVNAQHTWGLRDVELLSGDDARRRFPFISPEVRSARFRQGDGFINQKKLTMCYARASRTTVCVDTEVNGFRIESGRVCAVITSRGEVATDSVVIAAGPFSGNVANLAGLDLPLVCRIQQKVVLPDVPEVPHEAPMTIDDDTGAHFRPIWAGAYVLRTDHHASVTPPLDDVPASSRAALDVLNPASEASVARVAPFWKKVWERNSPLWFAVAGQYTYTPDHRPFLGPTPVAGLFLNCGYSGHGVMGSCGGSRIVVDTITGNLPSVQNPFRLDREMVPREQDVL